MKLSLVAVAAFLLLAPARADVITPGTPLRVTFRVVLPVQPAPPDTLQLLLDHPFIQAPIGTYTSNLFNGQTLLGTYASSALGTTTGQVTYLANVAEWKSPASLFTVNNPTVIDFTSLVDGSIDGVIEFTIATGEIDVDLSQVQLFLIKSTDCCGGTLVQPQAYITSLQLGAFEDFCFGDGGLATACPCNNVGQREHGCQNSRLTGGARLVASGTTSPDTVVLTSLREMPNALSIFLQGDALVQGGATFGDGLRCIGGNLKRLYLASSDSHLGDYGDAVAPQSWQLPITAQSAALGDPIAPGETRYYQTYYRDSQLSYCPSPMGDSWNVSSAVAITW